MKGEGVRSATWFPSWRDVTGGCAGETGFPPATLTRTSGATNRTFRGGRTRAVWPTYP